MYSIPSTRIKSNNCSSKMEFSSKSLVSTLYLAVLLLAIAGNLYVECQEQQLTIESRQQKDNDDLTDTIKYLEKLDKYFSQMARPRFGRSNYKQTSQLQQQQQLATQPTQFGDFAPRYGSLVDLINNRLAQSYKDSNY